MGTKSYRLNFYVPLAMLLCLNFGRHTPGQIQSGQANESAARAIDEYAQSASALGFSGTLLVARGHEVLLYKGYGWADRARGVPNDTSTIFYFASLSKQFTAAAILSLEAQGKLATTDKINLYLPGVPADKADITIHQLLTHTSGLPQFGWDEASNDWRVMGRKEAVNGILHSKLTNEPGSKFQYGNANYILLAAIVETVSGTAFQSFLSQNLFRPAGIDSVWFGAQTRPEILRNVAIGYGDWSLLGSYLDRLKSWLCTGGGDMLLSVGDLHRWHLALRDGKVLPAAQLEKLFKMQTTIEPGYGYAYGWWVRQSASGKRIIFHGGDFRGYHSEFRWYPDADLTLIIATNNEFRGTSITETMLNDIAGILKGQRSPLPPVLALNQEQLSRYAGDYYVQRGGWLQVSPGDGKLEIEAAGPRAADILANGVPDGAKDRELDGERALNLIARLKREERNAYADVLAPQVLPVESEFKKEWDSLGARLGGLRSYQILSTVYLPSEIAN